MTQLAIHTREEGQHFLCRWQCGARSGEVHVASPRGNQPRLLAELLALSHLAVDKKVIGLNTGVTPLTICASEPGVAQAVHHPQSSTPELRLRSRALRARFGDARFERCDTPPTLLPGAEVSMLAIDRPIDWTVPLNSVPVVVTEHAVKQVQHRHRFANRGYAYRFIQRWSKRRLQPAALPPAVVAEKLAKYSTPGAVLRDDTGWHGVIVDRTLVTMFFRDPRN